MEPSQCGYRLAPGWIAGCKTGVNPIQYTNMASRHKDKRIGGAGSSHRRAAGSASGLADFRVRKAGSDCKSSERPVRLKFRVGSLNVGTLKGRSSEVVETLTRRRVDLCCLQETRWSGGLDANQARYIKGKDSRYKFYWCGNKQGQGGVGIVLAEKWVEKVFEIGLPDAEKERFYDQLQSTIAKIPASEILFPIGDWNGHVGEDVHGFEEVHGGHGFGDRNAEGERLLEFALANDLLVGNTLFIKRESHLVTYTSGNHRTQIDYILFRRSFRKAVTNVKVIPGEECARQHQLLVCDFVVRSPAVRKRKFTPRLRTWKLRDPAVARKFQETFVSKVGTATTSGVEALWSRLKTPLLEAAVNVCGYSKNHQWKPETWWWDDQVDEAVSEKRARFKVYNSLKKQGKTAEAKVAKTAYIEATSKRHAKHTVWQAKSEAEKETFAVIDSHGEDVYRIAKQMERRNQDVVGEKCVRNDAGELSLNDEDKMKAWVEHYNRLLNVEFDWPKDELPEAAPVVGPPPPVTTEMISKALGKMRFGKAVGPSGINAEMLKAAGEEGIELTRLLTEAVFSSGTVPSEWEKSFILNLYKGKGEALDRGNYRGLKLTDHVMKLLECVLDSAIRMMVNIDDLQFAFVPGKGTTDAILQGHWTVAQHHKSQWVRHLPFKTCGKVFDSCVRAAMLHGSESWAPTASDLQRLRRNDRAMIRWICGAKPQDETPSETLHAKLGLVDIASVLRSRRLRWYGHVERASGCINAITKMQLPGSRGRGRPRKSWMECVRKDMKVCGLTSVSPLDRAAWKRGVTTSRLLPTPVSGTPAAV
ncbi:Hypp2763 [Branchiostoma lanceolatum]|uniref:Hypp2763 protein n=1 Tax=Branchiostoma lanceolatum TaxID=7740 RepID=A0A8J9ZX13_BRALA|nr:Hypp2763 [Branchiostoma lanceolatum]